MRGQYAGRAAVYQLYDTDGALLYVGVARNPDARWGYHSTSKSWWGDVTRRELAWFDTRAEAFAAEKSAIKAGRPRYNVLHNETPESEEILPIMEARMLLAKPIDRLTMVERRRVPVLIAEIGAQTAGLRARMDRIERAMSTLSDFCDQRDAAFEAGRLF